MRKQTRAVATARCGIWRECANTQCVFWRTHFKGAKEGKDFYPKWTSVGKSDFADILCHDFIDKDTK